MSEVDDRKQLQVLVNRINAVGISVFGAQGWEALREPKAERCLDCGRTDRVIDSRDAEVDDRKAAIRRAQEVAGNYRKRANTADPTSRSFDRLRMASDHATADLLEHLASLLSLTPTQPDRETLIEIIRHATTPGTVNGDDRAQIADALLASALFNGGTKP